MFIEACEASFNSPLELTTPTGELGSPGYPNDYYSNLNCYWRITVPNGLVLLRFRNFETESCCDYLEVS